MKNTATSTYMKNALECWWTEGNDNKKKNAVRSGSDGVSADDGDDEDTNQENLCYVVCDDDDD